MNLAENVKSPSRKELQMIPIKPFRAEEFDPVSDERWSTMVVGLDKISDDEYRFVVITEERGTLHCGQAEELKGRLPRSTYSRS